MNKTLIVFPDAKAISDFIFSRELPGAEVNTKELTVIAQMGDNDVLEAVTEYKGHLNEGWPSLPNLKC